MGNEMRLRDIMPKSLFGRSLFIVGLPLIFLQIFLGYFFFRNLKFNKFHFYSLGLTPLVIYVFNSGNYPNFIMIFFLSYGDKFQFIKGLKRFFLYAKISLDFTNLIFLLIFIFYI